MLLAVEALRASGDDEGSAKRLDQLARVAGGDARPTIARAVRALWRNEVASPALRLPEGDLTQVSDALHTALRLRGLERKDSTSSDGERSPNEFLVQARAALDRGDVAGAAPLLAQLTSVAELAPAVRWLAASLQATTEATRPEAARLLRELVRRGDAEARSVLLLRAIELEDSETLDLAVREPGPLGAAERMTLAALAGLEIDPSDPQLDVTAETPGMSALAAAITALSRITAEGDARTGQLHARAHRVAGSAQSRAQVTLGRWLATSATATEIVGALVAFGEHPPPSARALALEMDSRAGRALEVSRALETWGSTRETTEDRTAGALAAALVAERAGETARATAAFQAARAADPTNEAALRALASIHSIDLVTELNTLAEELGDGVRGAIARIEAISRGSDMLPEPTRVDLLERAHRAAPTLPIAAFLAERIARSGGNVDEMLRWVRERRASTADAVEAGLDAVREALLLADRDRDLAGERLHEAQRARPSDVALRELYERMTPEAPEDRAAWREQRAADAVGDARALLFLDAAREYERSGDDEGALRCAEAASATDSALARVVRERTELGGSKVSRLADELLTLAKATEDAGVRREAYERLAVLDATARQDPASALLWHRSILEEQPGYLPSLRYVEQHLIGEGRDEELEPIASGIAFALKGKGSVEASAHAELAARLRLRGPEGSWESTRELVQLASAETPPTLWSLRMLEAHSRATGDDETFLSVLMKLIERTTRPVETAALLIHAGEAAARLGRLDEAKALLQRAAVEDPGDVVAWGLLAEVRQRAGDARGAAEACEALARSSVVPEHQLLAWYDAGRIWQDDALEEDRAIVALESAAALDPSYAEIFDRLSRLYAARKMQPELAALLERRLEGVTDAEERLVLEVRRGQILLEVGDPAGARSAFEAALAQRPDDAGALSAYADLCVAQRDWDAAEQALVRLARLLPTPDEQRDVYARLGELYSKHLVNLARAEVAFKEVLRRAPDDAPMTEKLIDVYRRQNDSARAVELQQELVTKAKTQDEKRARLVALATIYENVGHDNRKAEQTLEVARREFPQDVVVLRALAEFYTRHQQTPAVNILLDRAGSDARRGLAAGRFSTALFELLATVFELRGKKDAARVAQAMLAALEGRPSELRGAAERAFDPRLDDLLAPEVLSPAMRTLLFKTGHALDAAVPFDARGQRATTLSHDTPIARIVATASQALGLGSVQVLVSPRLGVACLPCSSAPPVIVVGEALATQERLAGFLVLRALKLVQARASALARMPAAELPVLVSAWLKCFNPTWQPQGVNAAAVNAMGGKIQAALPRHVEPDVGVVALEVAGTLGTQAASLGVQALNWGNRTTLLALGDATGLLDAIAVAGGLPGGAPRDPKERAAWIQRTAEARDTIAFGVSDAFADARMRTGVDR
jgi:tetratricopeptide (TPR) repeat protein